MQSMEVVRKELLIKISVTIRQQNKYHKSLNDILIRYNENFSDKEGFLLYYRYTHIFIQRGKSFSDLVPNSALPNARYQSRTVTLAEAESSASEDFLRPGPQILPENEAGAIPTSS